MLRRAPHSRRRSRCLLRRLRRSGRAEVTNQKIPRGPDDQRRPRPRRSAPPSRPRTLPGARPYDSAEGRRSFLLVRSDSYERSYTGFAARASRVSRRRRQPARHTMSGGLCHEEVPALPRPCRLARAGHGRNGERQTTDAREPRHNGRGHAEFHRTGLGRSGRPGRPTVTGITPASAPNDIDAAVTITGTGFAAAMDGTVAIDAARRLAGRHGLDRRDLRRRHHLDRHRAVGHEPRRLLRSRSSTQTAAPAA